MSDRVGIQTVLFMMLMLQVKVAQQVSYISIRDGDDVTLSCGNRNVDHDECPNTDWSYYQTTLIDQFKSGKIEKTISRSDRLSLTQNCSLHIKKVTEDDGGRYFCRQFTTTRQQLKDSEVDLSVVTMTEQNQTDMVTLGCSVSVRTVCLHTVRWLYQGKAVGKDHKDLVTSQSDCGATVTFSTSHFAYSSNYELLKCEVTDPRRNKQQFSFRSQTTNDKTTTTTKTAKAQTPTVTSPTNPTSLDLQDWQWGLIAVAVVLVLVLMILLVLNKTTKKGHKTQRSENNTLIPAVTQPTPEPSPDPADPGDGVAYASVSFTNKPDGRAQNKGEDSVTYSTVKASSSPDPSSLYATINEPI